MPQPARAALELYYGLAPDGVAHSQRRIAEQLGLTRRVVGRLLRDGVTQLLGAAAWPGAVEGTCVICGTAFVSTTGRTTCSTACSRQLKGDISRMRRRAS